MKNKFFNLNEILSYNEKINMVIGGRNVGKTFNTLAFLYNRFIKHKEQSLYVRRYENDLKKAKSTLFTKLQTKGFIDPLYYPELDGTLYSINNEPFMQCVALSTSRKYKGAQTVTNCRWLMFDEFLLDKGRETYLSNELSIFLDLILSFERDDGSEKSTDGIRAIMLANSTMKMNPYFIGWDIDLKDEAKFTRHPTRPIIVQRYSNDELAENMKKTAFGRLIAGTTYEDYAIGNKFVGDNDNFIEKISGKTNYIVTLSYNGKNYGVYYSPDKGMYYVSSNYDENYHYKFQFSTEDHSPNYLLFKTMKYNPTIKSIMYAYEIGKIRFTDYKTKMNFIEMFGYL